MPEDHPGEDELQPEQTAGFKVGQKKTLDEYSKLGKYQHFLGLLSQQIILFICRNTGTRQTPFSHNNAPHHRPAPAHISSNIKVTDPLQLDEHDESLRKYKESLGLVGNRIGDPSDSRRVVMQSLGLEVAGRPDIIIDLSSASTADQERKVAELKSKSFTIKEGAQFRMKAKFRVQHDVLSGLKYVQVVKKLGMSNKTQEMIGSFSPNTTEKPEYEAKFETETAPSGMIARGHYNASSKFVDDDGVTHLKFEWSFDIKKDW